MWNPPETAPRDGKVFRITTAGPQQDLCWYDKSSRCFRDYHYKQKIINRWPTMVGWAPMGPAAHVGDTEDESRRLNGWSDKKQPRRNKKQEQSTRPTKVGEVTVLAGHAGDVSFEIRRYRWSDGMYGYCYDALVGGQRVADNAGFDEAMETISFRLSETMRKIEINLADSRKQC